MNEHTKESAFAIILVTIIEINLFLQPFLHECGHYLAALYMGASSAEIVISKDGFSTFWVLRGDSITEFADIFITSAGSLFTLFISVILISIFRLLKSKTIFAPIFGILSLSYASDFISYFIFDNFYCFSGDWYEITTDYPAALLFILPLATFGYFLLFLIGFGFFENSRNVFYPKRDERKTFNPYAAEMIIGEEKREALNFEEMDDILELIDFVNTLNANIPYSEGYNPLK